MIYDAHGHKQVRVRVWAMVDIGIAAAVSRLMRMPGVLTHTSCQGTESYRPYVMVSWEDDAARADILAEFDLSEEGDHWGYAHPRAGSRTEDSAAVTLKGDQR